MLNQKKRILTGERPTGKLHLGHYVGSLANRVKLQNEYETFIIIADVQALTTHFKDPAFLKQSVLEVTLDNLAVGINPETATIFLQSTIPQIAELTVFYSMLVPVNVLRHNPTIKTEAKQYGYAEMTYGFLGYPVSQTADITFCQADLVPVGVDQAPHIELTRKLVRRFNTLYQPVLTEPEILLGDCPRLLGIDGDAKMSKSLQNAIFLSDTAMEVQAKLKVARTDPARIHVNDLGHPKVCVIHQYYQAFHLEGSENCADLCRKGQIGCSSCKQAFTQYLNEFLDPIRERRCYYESRLGEVQEIVEAGNKKAREIGERTVAEVKEAIGIRYF